MVKAVTAALLLIVLIALGVLLWKAFLRADGVGVGKRTAHASAGALVTMLALFSLAIAMANIQGAAAPFASLLPMLAGTSFSVGRGRPGRRWTWPATD